jgi:hypothetical protein
MCRCCHWAFWYRPIQTQPEIKAFVPLQSVEFKALMENGHATLTAKLCFINNALVNSKQEAPIECTYEFPMSKDIQLTKL